MSMGARKYRKSLKGFEGLLLYVFSTQFNINLHQLKVKTFEFDEHVRDMCWTRPPGVHDHTHFLLAAAGSDISIIR